LDSSNRSNRYSLVLGILGWSPPANISSKKHIPIWMHLKDYINSILIRAFCDRMPYVTEEPNLGFCRCKIDVDIGYFMGWFHEVFSWEIFMDVLGKIRYFVTHKKTGYRKCDSLRGN